MSTADFLATNGPILLQLLERDYGLLGDLTALPGEKDVNLRFSTKGATFLVKIAPADCEQGLIELQTQALEHIRKTAPLLRIPRVVLCDNGDSRTKIKTSTGTRTVWVTTWLTGSLLADVDWVDDSLCEELGHQLGQLDHALLSFDHECAQRELKWDLRQSGWIEAHLPTIEDRDLRNIISGVLKRFGFLTTALFEARHGVIHNDANDYNVFVATNGTEPRIGLIDFGDMCNTVIVGDVAIAACYAAMHHSDPLAAIDAVVRGFHIALPLSDGELALVMPLVETRLAVSITNASIQQRLIPEDPYVTVSQEGATRLLRFLDGRDHAVALERLRRACGLPTDHSSQRIVNYLRERRSSHHSVLKIESSLDTAIVLDLSFGSTTGGDDPTHFDSDQASDRIRQVMRDANSELAIGRYGEPRPIYTDEAFCEDRPNGRRRTVHLGIDIFAPTGTEVMAPLPGQVHATQVCDGHLDYGGLVILRHELPDGTVFGTLFGHLDPASIKSLRNGQELQAGETFAQLGNERVNGGWPPHLHLQILASDPDGLPAVPRGVADPDDLQAHATVYPDPSDLLGLSDARAAYQENTSGLVAARAQLFGANLKTSYEQPLALVRGFRHNVFDHQGRKYLDAYNNVPHVGHCHPHVTSAIQKQTALLTTNTRYLHQGMQDYAEKLREILPNKLSVFFFTASGSEANELALRMVRKHTGAKDLCVMDHGYHGHTTATMAMSPYKFRQPGAPPKPDWVHVTVQPDVYRGAHSGPDAGARYAAEVAASIDKLRNDGRGLAAYLCESLPSVGGQLELPAGFLSGVYEATRKAGGLCIADDVQTALWRTGSHAFGFEGQGVVPDLLVLGKPLGNGFPMGAVVTTKEVAESFADGPEFFSTFGGSTVAMAAGCAVMDVLRTERMADNAIAVGDHLLAGLRSLQTHHEIIGDVRGRGLFLGVELVEDRTSKQPATETAARIKNHLRQQRILIGTDGPHDNVLKIRPPMTFDTTAADCLIEELGRALAATTS